MIEPTTISRCQHTFCRSCIEKSEIHNKERNKKKCPNCFQPFLLKEVQISLVHKNLIDDVWVHCLHKKCTWKGKFSMFNQHLHNLKTWEEYKNLKNEQLLEIKNNNDENKEKTLSISKLPKKCKHIFLCDCKNYIDMNSYHYHQSICMEIIIECECGIKIKKKEYQEHINKDCSFEVVNCECSVYGCKWSGKRRYVSITFGEFLYIWKNF